MSYVAHVQSGKTTMTPVREEKPAALGRRASEIVRSYLLAEFSPRENKVGTRLPSIKELAERLQVSTGTVQSVLQKLAGEGVLRVQKGSGSYIAAQATEGKGASRVLVTMPLERLSGQQSGWMERLGGGIFNAALQAAPPLTLEGIAPRSVGNDGLVSEMISRMESVDGLLLMPYSLLPKHQYLIDAYENAGKPVVSLQVAPFGVTANFVAADYTGTARRVAQMWAATGRKRVAMLRVEPAELHRPVIEAFRFGLMSGLSDPLQQRVRFEMVDGPSDWVFDGAKEAALRRIKAGGELPDAWFCENDVTAAGVIAALKESGISVPDQACVIAATDTTSADAGMSKAIPTFHVSRFAQPLGTIGQTAIRLLLERIEVSRAVGRSVPLPGRYVPFTFVPG